MTEVHDLVNENKIKLTSEIEKNKSINAALIDKLDSDFNSQF